MDQELGNAGEIAVAVHGLSTAPLPRDPITTTTPIPRTPRISTTQIPRTSSLPNSILNNLIPQKSQTFERFTIPRLANTPANAAPQRTTQYFPTYGKFPTQSSTKPELAFFQTITRPSATPQTAPQQGLIETTSHREIPAAIYTKVGTNIPQIVEHLPTRIIQQEYTGSTLPTPVTRTITLESPRPAQYQQYRLSTPSSLISRPSNINSQKTLDFPRISSVAPQIISRPIELESTSPRGFTRITTNPQSRPSDLDRLPPPRGLTPEEFARLSPPGQLVTRTQGIETEAPRGLTTPEHSQRITLITRPASGQEYDYYDSSVLSQLPPNSKVLVLPSGTVQCLDRGNFPHPESCKKFISCYEGGVGEGLIGWEYTCPRGLSFDPIGGICNWSAGLGCKQ